MTRGESMYHSLEWSGYWTGSKETTKDLRIEGVSPEVSLVPLRVKEQGGTLVMVLSTNDGGNIFSPIDDIPGLRVVQGDSETHQHEEDGELLIEIQYFNKGQLEEKVRRIRPTGIKFGIMGDTEEDSIGHRSLGESADYYLEGEHTIHLPEKARRAFPFWRIGVYGKSSDLEQEYLPEPQPQATP